MRLPDLPIVEVLDDVRMALRSHGRAVIAAPPGAGKTTVIPLALVDEPWRADSDTGSRRIVVLEPRRLAARAAARRMADLAGEPVGGLVGYQTRDERRIGASTIIEVLTEGVLTRRLQSDPEFAGVAAVMFDEVHERNLTTDLGLALVLDVAATLRPDLRIVAMSATADTAIFANLLTNDDGPAPVIASDGRMHPVDIRWLPRPRTDRSGIDAATTSAVLTALADNDGDVLAFLPGIGEIMRTAERLRAAVGPNVDVRPLAGALSMEEQDLALAPSPPGRRRVVLATDIAETSLTVDGVRVVVDSGLARSPRFDNGTAMTKLTTVSISRDSADQRAGRAGRLAPGVAYRLWSKIEHGTRNAHQSAEITTVDLSGLALELAAWGTGPDGLRFADPPPARTWKQAGELLRSLGALDGAGKLTTIGTTMVKLPLHPRLARMLAGAPTSAACVVAALLDDRDVMRGSPDSLPADLALRVGVVCGHLGDDRADRGAVHRVRDRAKDLARRLGVRFDTDEVDPDNAGLLLLAGFPDRLAGRRRDGQFQLRSGAAVFADVADPIAAADFVVAADISPARGGGRGARSRIRLAAVVEAWQIAGVLDDVVAHERLAWDSGIDDLTLTVERRLDALRLDTRMRRAEPGEATTAALLDRVKATRLAVLTPSAATVHLQARVGFLRATFGAPWPDLGNKALLATIDDWLAPYLAGATGRADLERVDVATLLRSQLPWPLGADIDKLAPVAWTLPANERGGGRDARIDYTVERPTVSVRVQDVFGVTQHPAIAAGTVPLTLALLSPADRPIQVTADLPGFWAGSWAVVRKDLAGRYPKHRWPTDPASELPGRRKT